jgi:hypothetical protein
MAYYYYYFNLFIAHEAKKKINEQPIDTMIDLRYICESITLP